MHSTYNMTASFLSFTPSERVALGSAFLVLLGVIGEEVVELSFFEKKDNESKRQIIKKWAIWLLLIGLTGDGVGIVMGQAEMQALTKEAGDAKISATEANNKANEAKGSAAVALTDSRDASIKAGKAKQDADAADKSAGEAIKRARQLEARTEFRQLSPEQQKTLTAAMKPFSGQKFIVMGYIAENDSPALASQISAALNRAGWQGALPTAQSVLGNSAPEVGIIICVGPKSTARDIKAANALAMALRHTGLPCPPVKHLPENPTATLGVMVDWPRSPIVIAVERRP